MRRSIVERFISRWRKEVGPDIFPAFRLIIPDKDRERPMYGLKEKAIAKLLIKVMKINKDSDDGFTLLNWKQPGQSAASRMAGDFAGRCYEVLSKRAFRSNPGDLTITQVNDMLDQLSAAQKEENQLPIFDKFYRNMNADELMWLIRITLRQMKVGATEKTFFDIWHPDAETLFSVSSNLRRVCWELHEPSRRLETHETTINLMQCFQPQLAAFQMHDFGKMIQRMRLPPEDPEFWVEEKLDGERMQLHMIADDRVKGGKRFAFWSRKAKDYTYLYGEGFEDEKSALTRHIKGAFEERVDNLILDGEMIEWDPEQNAMVPFGTLKTAALSEQRNPFSTASRPLYRVFDLLYLNGRSLIDFELKERRRALEACVKSVDQRLEVHTFKKGSSTADIEPLLRQVVLEASEGLVIKNPHSPYQLNMRSDNWMKVKPEYMTEFGEDLDCIVIGGYYGSGRRGGNISSFLCGLRVDQKQIAAGANRQKCFSFFKVGGGLAASDYAQIRHLTDGKWKDWNPQKPPIEFIELGGGDRQYERPDVWIRPGESVVVAVKAASINVTDQFRMGFTLRFPRFKSLRTDRNWESALSISGFQALKANAEKEKKEKEFQIDDSRKTKRARTSKKKPLIIAGHERVVSVPYEAPIEAAASTSVFKNLNFYIITESLKPERRTKQELEDLVRLNGGNIFQKQDAAPTMICVGDKMTVRVSSLKKRGGIDVLRPLWLFDCLAMAGVDTGRKPLWLPPEPKHMLFIAQQGSEEKVDGSVDAFGDSYARETSIDELRQVIKDMDTKSEFPFNRHQFRNELAEHGYELGDARGWLFEGLRIYLDGLKEVDVDGEADINLSSLRSRMALNTARFGSATMVHSLDDDEEITHIVTDLKQGHRNDLKEIRQRVSTRKRLPRIVTVEWIERSWEEKTRLAEEGFEAR